MLAAVATGLVGCAGFGPGRLISDEVGYSAALSQSRNDETLADIVRIRYGDSPVFLHTSQIISGYRLQNSISPHLRFFPFSRGDDELSGAQTFGIQQNPTFTLEPVTGEELARSIIRPLSPAQLLPLSLTSLPIDTLFRLAVQSVNGLRNSEMISSSDRAGSTKFFVLLRDLRRLQLAALLGVRLKDAGSGDKDDPSKETLTLSILDSRDPDLHKTALEARALLGMRPDAAEAEVVYGAEPAGDGKIAILTRPILGVLRQVASEIQVPADDVKRNQTPRTLEDNSRTHRPPVVVHTGPAPPNPFAKVEYHGRRFWISNDDFESKAAYSVVQLLLTLAQTKPNSGTLVTIPAG